MMRRPPHHATVLRLLRRPATAGDVRRSLGVDTATRRMLVGVVLPLWLGAGLADWYAHRRTNIETTSGARESAIHALMMAEAGVPVVLGLFFETNAGTLAVSTGALGAHSVTTYWDATYAEERRKVSPGEQHVHSLLEVVPLMATSFALVLHWDQALALAGRGPAEADFRLRPLREPLSLRARVGLLAAMGVFGALPFAEELWRCLRARPTLRAQPVKDGPRSEALREPAAAEA